jgi:hypothetical protein
MTNTPIFWQRQASGRPAAGTFGWTTGTGGNTVMAKTQTRK